MSEERIDRRGRENLDRALGRNRLSGQPRFYPEFRSPQEIADELRKKQRVSVHESIFSPKPTTTTRPKRDAGTVYSFEDYVRQQTARSGETSAQEGKNDD